MSINSVNYGTYVHAALASNQEAKKLLSPNTILEMIKNFFTCGGVTRERMENLADLKAAIYNSLYLSGLSSTGPKENIPLCLEVEFLGGRVNFHCPMSSCENENDVCVQITDDSGILAGSTYFPKKDYTSFLLKLQLEAGNPAQYIATNVESRENSTEINSLFDLLLERLGFLNSNETRTDDYNGSYSSFSVEYPEVILHSVRPMVGHKELSAVCDELRMKSEVSNKIEITPLGIVHRPGPYEGHAVLLICRPEHSPLIIDSKSGPGYPKGIDVVTTGNQSFFDRKSCWAHAVQQAIHYTYFLANGVKFEHMEPYRS
ncbi:MAG: hypothetical protein HYZ77_04820 [Serratia liquefaciens]|nr:hypothetical protein [Serratia liquefaciens]